MVTGHKKSVVMLACILVFYSACGRPDSIELRVLHAGSLSAPFREIAAAFEKENPGIDVLLEAHGSRTCARQISDLGRSAEVMASADSEVIRSLLIPQHARFCIDFAGNEMVIMYTDASRGTDRINSSNWYQVLLTPGVQYGHSDPNSDPCGYRSQLVWKLAEKFYRLPGLFDRLNENMPERNIRPKEVDLIALLESGELDYIMIYRSVAEQHRARYLILPDEINLKSSRHNSIYHSVSVRITGQQPGEWMERRGEAMVYGITLPLNAVHPELGIRFIAFILGDSGRAIMARNGHPLLSPLIVDRPEFLPEALKNFFTRR